MSRSGWKPLDRGLSKLAAAPLPLLIRSDVTDTSLMPGVATILAQ